MFKSLKRSRATRRQQQDELVLQRVFQEGYDARTRGQPCTPPAGYRIEIGFDLVGEWIAGWGTADRELDTPDQA